MPRSRLAHRLRRWLLLAAVLAAPPLQAAGISSVSPQGRANDVRQVAIRFDADMVMLGQNEGLEPASVRCTPQSPQGQARWAGPRTWVFEFAKDLEGGTRCEVVFKPGLATLAGESVAIPPPSSFVAGPHGFFGPVPFEGTQVAPDQIFLLRHHGPPPAGHPRELAAGFACELRDGEKVRQQPALPVSDAELKAAVRAAPPGAYALALRCAEPLPEGVQMRLRHVPAGSVEPEYFQFITWPRFTAEVECTVLEYPPGRKNCDPRRPVGLVFSAPIDIGRAAAIRLTDGAGTDFPFDKAEPWRGAQVRQVRITPPNATFGEGARFTVRLPDGLRDTFGRPLANASEFPKTVQFAQLPPYLGVANPLAAMPWTPGKTDAVAAFAVRRVEKTLPLRQWRLGGEMGEAIEPYAIELLQAQQSNTWPAQDLTSKVGPPRTSILPTQGGAMEFVSLPLTAPGLHVVRADSAAFAGYLDSQTPRADRTRSAAPPQRYAVVQATNLNPGASLSNAGASVIWVTAFDTAQPVAGAEVAVYSCRRELLWRGRTDAQGLARPEEALRGKLACSHPGGSAPPLHGDYRSADNGPWVVVRAGEDMAVLHASLGWNSYVAGSNAQNVRAHTVLDRTLFKAGETVSMQHVVRLLESRGFALPEPGTLDVRIHYGWRDQVHAASLPLGADGSAASQWTIPLDAKLGSYEVRVMQRGQYLSGARFQVEEFRTPVFDSEVHAKARWERDKQFAMVDARLSYFAGGAAAGLPVTIRQSWSRDIRPPMPGYIFYGRYDNDAPPPIPPQTGRLDADGKTQARLAAPPLTRPMLLETEIGFEDPNGETQTTGASTMLWPDRMKLGLRVRPKEHDRPQAIEGIALDDQDRPLADEPVTLRVKPVQSDWIGIQRRFTDLGPETDVCSARTDAQGKWSCEWQLPATLPGKAQAPQAREEWLFEASASSLRSSRAVVRTAMLQSRWDLGWREIADRRTLQLDNGPAFGPGDTAVIVARPDRLPAQVLVTAEREGVLEASVHSLTQLTQRIPLPLAAHLAPNVQLAARYVYPLQGAGKDAPIGLVQRANVTVRPDAWTLSVGVLPATTSARPRAQVPVEIMVRDAAGQPVPDARVTLAAVDQALLALRPNATWGLAQAMFAARDNRVESSALDARLLRVVATGPRPEYRPWDEPDQGMRGMAPAAAPAPAASSMTEPREASPQRSDLSSLILWRTDLRTDERGVARVAVPLNDALTQFRIVAIASAGADRFGQGETTITSTQPLQIFSGLPQVLRADDALVQKLSVRNTGAAPLAVVLRAEAAIEAGPQWPGAREVVAQEALAVRGLKIERQFQLAAGQTQEIAWRVAVPSGAGLLRWRIAAHGGDERDALEVSQRVVPALTATVRQSTLLAVDGARAVPVVQPAGSLPMAGGVQVSLQASLVDAALVESKRWMAHYPFTCLEQQSSRFVALDDRAGWDRLMGELPKYIDDKGLVRYFPETSLPGSEMLTVQLLDLARAHGWPVPEAARQRMLNALDALLEGRLPAQDWTPRAGSQPQQLAAQATLAEHGRARVLVRPQSLASLSAQSLVDWARTLMALPAAAERDDALKEAGAQLRSRFDVQGTRLRWRDESAQHLWWFMWSGDSTAARMALLAQQWAEMDAAWKADAPLVMQGLVGRQDAGRWSTTTGIAWNTVALRRFKQQFEKGPVGGMTQAVLGQTRREAPWAEAKAPNMLLPWPAQNAQATLQLRHEGSGKPWATVSAVAAVRNTVPIANGLTVRRSVTPVEQKRKGRWSVGDVYRVRLDLESTAEQTWVVVRDALPSGASHIGRGLGRESRLAQRDETSPGWIGPSYVERATESWRAYFRYVPRGRWSVEYTVRLNNAGGFNLPPARAEAMYAPEVFGEGLAETMTVNP